MKRRHLPLVLIVVVALLTGCTNSSPNQESSAAGRSGGSSAEDGPNLGGDATPGDTSRDDINGSEVPAGSGSALAGVLPDAEVFDVASGTSADLRSLVDGERPLLVWFWAPHCPRCNREMPGLEAFARENPQLQLLGLGTQDSAEEAQDFAERHDVTAAQLVWDSAFGTWDHFGVVAQPYGILYSPAGVELDRWTGEVDLDEVAALL